jgi:hypothetical protein
VRGGGGGGGFFSAGGSSIGPTGGGAFPDLAGGSLGGGFGGGGGFVSPGADGSGGGGGSFDAGTDQILVADFQTGNGEVLITELAAAVPEPASIALLCAGVASLAVVWRRRRPET